MQISSSNSPRAFASATRDPETKLRQIQVVTSCMGLPSAAVRLFSALVVGSDDSGRVLVTHAEMVDMAGLMSQGRTPAILLSALQEYGLLEYDSGYGEIAYAIRITLAGDILAEELDVAARRMREARRRRKKTDR